MSTFAFSRYALSIGAVAALLAGCSGSQPPVGAQGTAQRAQLTGSFRVLHAFGNDSDGARPQAPLIDVDGMLYGTTYAGGGRHDGTVYSISLNGSEKVLYSFIGGSDGANPEAPLIDVNGTLYGTTSRGGENGDGTVYSISPTGSEKVLYSFAGGSDGANPVAPLIDVNGTLYGTTQDGGGGSCQIYGYGCGTVYSVSTAGVERVLHSFDRDRDGAAPHGGLVDVHGTLYGTTEFGGRSDCNRIGCGTVYRISFNGSETVLYRFAGRPDGLFPTAALIDVGGTLYGTTSGGGTYPVDGGTVFSITTNGKEQVLHSFGGADDGLWPIAGLVDVKGTLYGTTPYGPSKPRCSCQGTVFSISIVGAEQSLSIFGRTHGSHPLAGLIDANGTLYGTANGAGRYGAGTVFVLNP